MEERLNTRRCDRENDLIAFLYGEVNEREAQDFERHLRTCSECQSELSAFKPIRQSMIAWRDEALGRIRETILIEGRASVPRKQSAVAALREFFNLSPLWLKGVVAFASIVFCVFGSLALARLFNRDDGSVSSNDKKIYTQEDLNKKIDEAVQAKSQELANRNESRTNQTATANEGLRTIPTGLSPGRRSTSPHSAKTLSRPLTKTEREQLAADLRLISSKDEVTLDLLGDRINQEQ